MSRPSFRPRPIDLTKPLPIINTSKDLRHEDDVVVSRALPAVATGVDPAEEEERHLQQALLASVFGADRPAPADIPVPVVSARTPPDMPGTRFHRPPAKYIMFDRSDHDLEDAVVEYDADHVDAAFLRATLAARPHLDPHLFNLDLVERVMDALEKAQGRHSAAEQRPAAPPHTALLPYPTVRSMLADLVPSALPEPVRRDLHAHWHRRRTHNPAPFLRLYQPPPSPGNTDPSVAFRPRDRDPATGAATRTNTYDNFRRASILRDELVMLRDVLHEVVRREEAKKVVGAVRMLQQRMQVVASGGSRMEAVVRAIFSGEQEPVVVYGPPAMQVMVPCRDLALPEGIEVVQRRLTAGGDKISKKMRKKAMARAAAEKGGRAGREGLGVGGGVGTRGGGLTTGLDTFGYDEHGNKFLRNMRYFAGGFMNYGVSPYDHRVFAAASERNTVRMLPRDPEPITFPGPHVRFGSLPEPRRVPRGATMGRTKLSSCDVRADILGEMRALAGGGAGTHAPRGIHKTFRTRARMGRGGRILLDRVTFERERGVKAASYPASVEMGGVYTAGVPLDAARKVAQTVPVGALGNVLDLGAGLGEEEGGDEVDSAEEGLVALSRNMAKPLKPMVQLAKGVGEGPDVVKFWPRRSRGGGKWRGGKRGRGGMRREGGRGGGRGENRRPGEGWMSWIKEGEEGDMRGRNDAQEERRMDVGLEEERKRRMLPAYAPRQRPLVTDLS